MLAALRPHGKRATAGSIRTPLIADALLACACREHDMVLVTWNAGDFTKIQRHVRGFRFVSPWALVRR